MGKETQDINIRMPAYSEIPMADPEMLQYYTDLEKRIVWIDSNICDYTLEVGKKILQWNREDARRPKERRKPIYLLIFSYGGDLDVCNALIDIILGSVTPVYGVNIGVCASAAAFIYLACEKRFMFPRATFLLHKGSSAYSGTYDQVVSQVIDYQESIKELVTFVQERTQYDKQEIEEKITSEWYIRREESLKNGVCHKVIKNLEEI